MSISPSGANSPASPPPSCSALPSPNPLHGPPLSHPRASVPPAPAGSEEVEVLQSATNGSAIVIASGCHESANNLTGIRTGIIESCSHSPISGINSQDLVSNGSGESSERSNQRSVGQYSGKRMGDSRSLHSRRSIAGTDASHGNVIQPGARKIQMVNANHLLNFHYDPIQRSQPRLPPPRKSQKIRPFNRDLFLQANYRFIVLDTGNYSIESMDPDKMLEWDNIVSVSYSTPSFVQCPICLESPLCPQITSCGHIYCFPCILRYLLMGEEDHRGDCWKKCPLCFNMVSSKDLYTISINHVKQYEVGDHVKFSLLTRQKHSFVPFRKSLDGEDTNSSGHQLFDTFSKFLLTSDAELSVREAKSSLNEWLARADAGLVDDLERLPYVCAALEHLEQRMIDWADRQSVRSSSRSTDLGKNESRTKISYQNVSSSAKERASLNLSKNPDEMVVLTEKDEPMEPHGVNNERHGHQSSAIPSSLSESIGRLNISSSPSEGRIQKYVGKGKDVIDRDGYAFYQVTDGQHIVLHPLNMKCLLHHYKSYDLLPTEIGGKILQLESVTQSETTRRRFRFLSHFSLTTNFQLCEINLCEMLPPNAFYPFTDEIKRRERQREQLGREESRAKVVVDSDVVSNHMPSYRQISDSDASFSLDEFEALGSATIPSTSPPTTGERKLFSDVTRLGFAAAHDSPSLRAEDSVSLPSPVEGPSMPTLSFANILSTAKPVEIPEPRSHGFGKKGKKPTRVLLSTAGGRRY